MALATTTTPGSIILGGDLTGVANAPELRVTGVTAGTYTYPTIVVDAKGRTIYAVGTSGALVGDIIGNASSNTLTTTGVVAGTYTNSSLVVDSKGRITSASNGNAILSGDVTGDISNVVLSSTGTPTGNFNNISITVDAKGRITNVSTQTGFNIQGDVIGTPTGAFLAGTTVVPGAYTRATSITVNAQGRITNAVNGTNSFSGDLTGNITSTSLTSTGVTPGTYTNSSITVDAKGRISSIATGGASYTLVGDVTGTFAAATLPTIAGVSGSYVNGTITVNSKGLVTSVVPKIANTTTLGIVKGDEITVSVSAGMLLGVNANNTLNGFVTTGDPYYIDITDGLVSFGPEIALTSDVCEFSSAIGTPVTTTLSGPNLNDYTSYVRQQYGQHDITLPTPSNIVAGSQYDLSIWISEATRTNLAATTAALANVPTSVDWDGTKFVGAGMIGSTPTIWTSTDGLNWTTSTLSGASASFVAVTMLWVKNKFIITASNGQIAVSADGVNWTIVTSAYSAFSGAIIMSTTSFGNTLERCCIYGPGVIVLTDGTSWWRVDNSVATNNYIDAISTEDYSATDYVYVLYTASDGNTKICRVTIPTDGATPTAAVYLGKSCSTSTYNITKLANYAGGAVSPTTKYVMDFIQGTGVPQLYSGIELGGIMRMVNGLLYSWLPSQGKIQQIYVEPTASPLSNVYAVPYAPQTFLGGTGYGTAWAWNRSYDIIFKSSGVAKTFSRTPVVTTPANFKFSNTIPAGSISFSLTAISDGTNIYCTYQP